MEERYWQDLYNPRVKEIHRLQKNIIFISRFIWEKNDYQPSEKCSNPLEEGTE
jgi:hypothetical protein